MYVVIFYLKFPKLKNSNSDLYSTMKNIKTWGKNAQKAHKTKITKEGNFRHATMNRGVKGASNPLDIPICIQIKVRTHHSRLEGNPLAHQKTYWSTIGKRWEKTGTLPVIGPDWKFNETGWNFEYKWIKICN
jgi:hypothetical protein